MNVRFGLAICEGEAILDGPLTHYFTRPKALLLRYAAVLPYPWPNILVDVQPNPTLDERAVGRSTGGYPDFERFFSAWLSVRAAALEPRQSKTSSNDPISHVKTYSGSDLHRLHLLQRICTATAFRRLKRSSISLGPRGEGLQHYTKGNTVQSGTPQVCSHKLSELHRGKRICRRRLSYYIPERTPKTLQRSDKNAGVLVRLPHYHANSSILPRYQSWLYTSWRSLFAKDNAYIGFYLKRYLAKNNWVKECNWKNWSPLSRLASELGIILVLRTEIFWLTMPYRQSVQLLRVLSRYTARSRSGISFRAENLLL